MYETMKIVYMGTPDFAVPALEALVRENYDVRLVVTAPDKARDRGKKIRPTPVKQAAEKAGIPVAQPGKVKNNPEFIESLKEIAPDLIVVAAYGKILPPELIEIPPLGCVNLHASLLPRFRGAAPISRCIMEGDAKTGITLMYIEEGLDTGDMIAKAETPVGRKHAEELEQELAVIGADLLIEWLPKIASGDIAPEVQDDALACYAPMIEKSEGAIDFTCPAAVIERLTRGMPAKPGAYTEYQGTRMKILEAEVLEKSSDAMPGTILSVHADAFAVACGEGILNVRIIQMPGKKPVAVREYLKGNTIQEGTVLKSIQERS